jgi:glutamyl-tRNA synthetase
VFSTDTLLQSLLLIPYDQEIAKIQARYPPRQLSAGAEVTRFGPSPTGFLHLGALFTALISERLARGSGGRFFVRVEDTDKKREVPGEAIAILRALKTFGLIPDEGPQPDGATLGMYGPYVQSERTSIYHPFVAKLVHEDRAYACFCTESELSRLRSLQERRRAKPGYYGDFAQCRRLSREDAAARAQAGQACVIRLRSSGDQGPRIDFTDVVKGPIQLPTNDVDAVLLKSDGLPTYHFAHVIDDHLMGTTLVTRADEWISSMPLHLELWHALGWIPPKYAHLSPLQVIDGESKRKLSKTRDKEADVEFFLREGRPIDAIIDYLLNIANPPFEGWRSANPDAPWQLFPFDAAALPRSGALLDHKKLDHVARQTIANLEPGRILEELFAWASEYAPEWEQRLKRDPDYTTALIRLGTEGRRDFISWRGFVESSAYFFDDVYYAEGEYSFPAHLSSTDVEAVLRAYLRSLDASASRDKWWNNTSALGADMGFVRKQEERIAGRSKGTLADFTGVIRVALTKRSHTPDLYNIQQVMGSQRVRVRLMAAADSVARASSHPISDRVVSLSQRLTCWYVDHRSVGKDGVRRSLDAARRAGDSAGGSALAVSTCLRHEYYYLTEPRPHGVGFASVQRVEAVRRLLRVASGVDSELLGENEILLQIEQALATSYDARNVSADDYEAFGEMLSWAKEARRRTGFSTTANYGSAGATLAGRIVDWSKNPVVMIVGTGQVASSLAKALSSVPKRVVLVARDVTKAERFRRDALTDKQVVVVNTRDAATYFPLIDVLFTAVASDRPLFSAQQLESLSAAAVIVDLSYPSVFESRRAVNHFDLSNTDFSEYASDRPTSDSKRAIMEEIRRYVDQLVAILSR